MVGPDERSVIREGWPFERHWIIPGIDYSDAYRLVFAPLHGSDAHGLDADARIEASLTYNSIENARSDFRDNPMHLCLCLHAGLRAGLDVVRLFEEAAEISVDPMAWTLRGFVRGPKRRYSLWDFGFREVLKENGIVYEEIGLQTDYYDLRPTRLDEWGRVIEP
ncbi:MAG TPA: hypothetical protein VK689_03240 [Armatimonadota bacterium]|nr:hypothetical protein [Armatimonadota bacterium]